MQNLKKKPVTIETIFPLMCVKIQLQENAVFLLYLLRLECKNTAKKGAKSNTAIEALDLLNSLLHNIFLHLATFFFSSPD